MQQNQSFCHTLASGKIKISAMSLKNTRTTTGALTWDDFRSLISKLERDGDYKYCLLISIGVFTGLRISDTSATKVRSF